jgi:hypothetical protein
MLVLENNKMRRIVNVENNMQAPDIDLFVLYHPNARSSAIISESGEIITGLSFVNVLQFLPLQRQAQGVC